MANSYHKGPNARSLEILSGPDDLASGAKAAGPETLDARRALARLSERRWLVFFFAAILCGLAVAYRLPWQAQATALIAAAAGAALIPRSLTAPAPQKVVAAPKPAEPLSIAGSLIDALPEPVILLSRDGTVLLSNGKARDLFGGLKPGSHISSATRSPQVLDAVTDCGPEKPQRTVTFSERVPVERYMAATVSCLEAPPGKEPFTLLFLRDLTEQRRLDQLRSDFIANASHEIKTPLASLLGFIETLQGAARHDEAARERFLPIMAKQGERMARLIDNLMSLSRVEMRAHLKPRDVVALSELVRHACDALEPMAAEAGIEVKVPSELESVQVLGDRDELTQVFINLIHNAIKYGRPGGSVIVDSRTPPERSRKHDRDYRRGQWPWHRPPASAAPDRALLSGSRIGGSGKRRNRPRARNREACGEPPPRRASHFIHGGRRHDVYHPSGRAPAGRGQGLSGGAPRRRLCHGRT